MFCIFIINDCPTPISHPYNYNFVYSEVSLKLILKENETNRRLGSSQNSEPIKKMKNDPSNENPIRAGAKPRLHPIDFKPPAKHGGHHLSPTSDANSSTPSLPLSPTSPKQQHRPWNSATMDRNVELLSIMTEFHKWNHCSDEAKPNR